MRLFYVKNKSLSILIQSVRRASPLLQSISVCPFSKGKSLPSIGRSIGRLAPSIHPGSVIHFGASMMA